MSAAGHSWARRLVAPFAFALALFAMAGVRAEDAFAGYAYKAKITFGGYEGTTTLTNFPALVRLAEGTGGFSYANCRQSNGGDVRFTRGDGVELASSCASWNTSGTSEFWVRIPELTKDTVIYMVYGNADAPARDQRLQVWDEHYSAVWPMDDAGKNLADVSGRGNYGFASGDSARAAGIVGYSRDFTEEDKEYARAGHGCNEDFSTPSFSYECWYKLASYPTADRTLMGHAVYNSDFSSKSLLREMRIGSNGAPKLLMTSLTFNSTVAESPALDSWHCAVATYDGAAKQVNLYLDGVRVGGGSYWKTESSSDKYLQFSFAHVAYSGYSSQYLEGSLDEARVSRTVRGADYVAASYKNLANHDGFLVIEEQAEAIPAVAPYAKRKHTFTIAAGEGGGVSPSGTVEIEEGEYLEVTATASGTAKAFYAWDGDCPTTQVFSAKIRLPADCDRTLTARFGTAYHVKASDSSDDNDGRSPATAKATIGGALAQIETDVAAASDIFPAVVLVGEGTYSLTKAYSCNAMPEYEVTRAIAFRSADGKGKAVIDFKDATGNSGAFYLRNVGSVVDGFKFARIREGGAYSGIHRAAAVEAGHLLDCTIEVSTLASSDDRYVAMVKGWICGCDFSYTGSGSSTASWCNRMPTSVGKLGGCCPLVERCTFRNFKLGLSLLSGNWVVRNSLFEGCQATHASSGNGGAFSMSDTGFAENCTFVNCSAALKGGAIFASGAAVVNCAFSGNEAASADNGPDINGGRAYNCLYPSSDGLNGNVVGTPLYDAAKPGEYEPIATSLTRNGGAASDRMLQSGRTDLVGTNRCEETVVDIGCREFPAPAHEDLGVAVKMDVSSGTDSLTVRFEASVTGDKTGLTYAWDFGDGTTSDEAAPTHAYTKPGYYTVKLTIVNSAEETASYEGKDAVKVRSSTCYVREAGISTPAEPYATPETAADNLGDALSMGPSTIDVGEGAIPIGKTLRLNYAVRVVGAGPEKTKVTAGECGTDASNIYVEHADAVLTGIRVDGVWCNWGTMMSLSSGTISNCVFRNCGSNYTGTMFLKGGRLVDCVFDGCYSPHEGIGGVLVTGSSAEIERCVFTGLSGHVSGVAVLVRNTSAPGPTIRNCLFDKNYGRRVNVTAALCCSSPAVVENCTLVGNYMEFGAKAAGLYLSGGGCEVRNTIAWGNTVHATNIVENLDGSATTNIGWNASDVCVSAGKAATFSHCCAPELAAIASETVTCDGCIAADPLFNAGRRASRPTYSLRGNSPCVNTGVKLDWMTDGATDLGGNPRVFGGQPDMGCCENQSGGLAIVVR